MSAFEASSSECDRGDDAFLGAHQCRLFFRWARPEQALGVLAVIHGLGEHSGRHQPLAEEVVQGGFAYYGFDLRGHGKSGGSQGDIRQFEDYINDVDRFLQLIRRREAGLPMFLMGHSLGGIIAVLYSLTHSSDLAGLVVASTTFQLGAPPSRLSVLGARCLSAIAPQVKIHNDLDPAQLSSDPRIGPAYLADPLVQRTVTLRWATKFFANYEEATESAGKLSLPVLVLHGEADKIADVEGAKIFFEKLGSADKTLKVYPHLRHELHNELPEIRRQVFADLLAWLVRHAKASP